MSDTPIMPEADAFDIIVETNTRADIIRKSIKAIGEYETAEPGSELRRVAFPLKAHQTAAVCNAMLEIAVAVNTHNQLVAEALIQRSVQQANHPYRQGYEAARGVFDFTREQIRYARASRKLKKWRR